ncbi:S-adenosyl-L-methionine-dependent methyltransferase [Mollisia scopiformis]|uniref:S-adenosyl-L-methionine-dependent methyltransferase n=1 Tax=Mollisia scopiformis TaxID=149040 RepID=A0A132B9B6_MOLSC|nr:S-adenosyl-L-methionine-dependent methyltransferase [Mollisia scopiformis]KUJ08961.1 S-adenosyl-L-methionine-dependent methyltransferase [Mollisia scopiformis]
MAIGCRSDTASISSSLFQHVQENGRTYHKYKEGKYLLPNDEKEQNRLDLQHQLCKLSLHGRLHLAPLKDANLKHALDFGTGTGIWAIDFAEQYPNCKVLGSDLSPIQPEFVPENCTFEVDDLEDEWIYPQPFNYIHSRLMVFCLRSPISTIQKAYASLAPGGWLEMQDTCAPLYSIDNSIAGTSLEKCYDMVVEAAKKVGIDSTAASRYKDMMEEAGFVDVQEVKVEWPIGGWAKSTYHKTLGKWFRADLETGVEAVALGLFTRVLGMKKEEVESFLVDIKKDMDSKHVHAYQPFYIVFGRKPE